MFSSYLAARARCSLTCSTSRYLLYIYIHTFLAEISGTTVTLSNTAFQCFNTILAGKWLSGQCFCLMMEKPAGRKYTDAELQAVTEAMDVPKK